MKKRLMILAAGVTVMLAACNKEKQASQNVAPVKKMGAFSLSAINNDRAANPLNPYDSIGVIHNQVINVSCAYIQKTGDTSNTSIRNQVAGFFKIRYGTDINSRLMVTYGQFKKEFPGGQYASAPKGIFSATAESYLNRLLGTIQSIKDTNGYTTFKAAVVGIENMVIKDKNISADEQQHILMVGAVARYSMSYWLQLVNTGNGESDPMGFFHNVWKAINVAAADTCGAIDGMVHLDSPRDVLEEASFDSAGVSAMM
jgi:hypothetical protein